MITSLGKHAAVAATAVAVGGLGAIATQAATQVAAQAAGFSAAYTCSGPMLGTRAAVLDGWLTSPGQTAVNRPTGFQLHISSLNLGAPFTIDSWSASARVRVSGVENSAFRVAGSGGFVAAGQPLAGDLSGEWAPTVNGTHALTVGGITVSATTPAGNVTAYCTTGEPRPVAETLTVFPSFETGWSGPVVPPYNVVVPYRPGWHHPGWNRPGWNRPIVVVPRYHHGGSGRPGGPPHGGWSHHPHGH
jgi:hypothetical protein